MDAPKVQTGWFEIVRVDAPKAQTGWFEIIRVDAPNAQTGWFLAPPPLIILKMGVADQQPMDR